jgi:hypothetical protein
LAVDDEKRPVSERSGVSSGPLRLHPYEGGLVVTGFGLWIPVLSEKEGLEVIAELEEQGYRMCY